MAKCRGCNRRIVPDMLNFPDLCDHCRGTIRRAAERSRRLREDLTFTAADLVEPVKPAKKGSV